MAATHATPARSRRMDVHQNAKNTPRGRRSMIQRLAEGWTILAVAAAFDVDPKTVRKWRARFLAEGEAGLADRSSRPHRSPTRLGEATTTSRPSAASGCPAPPSPAGSAARSRPWPAWSCAAAASAGSAPSTPSPSSSATSAERPGELIHIDIKKLGRGSAPKSGSRPARCRVDCSRDRQFGGGPAAAQRADQRSTGL